MRTREEIEADAACAKRLFDWLHSWCRASSGALTMAVGSYLAFAVLEAGWYGAPEARSAAIALLVGGFWWVAWWFPSLVCGALCRRLERLAREMEALAEKVLGER